MFDKMIVNENGQKDVNIKNVMVDYLRLNGKRSMIKLFTMDIRGIKKMRKRKRGSLFLE